MFGFNYYSHIILCACLYIYACMISRHDPRTLDSADNGQGGTEIKVELNFDICRFEFVCVLAFGSHVT